MDKQEQPRDIQDVICSILEVIPKTETKVRTELEKFSNKILYKPPEMLNCPDFWLMFANILNRNIPHITQEWQIQIQKIINKE